MSLTEDEAARKLQNLFRTRAARANLRTLIQKTIEKVYDAETGYYFYFNTKTGESSWEKPRALKDDEDLFTPRSRANFKIQADKKLQGRMKKAKNMTEEEAALTIQGLYRSRSARKMLQDMCSKVFEKVYDESTDTYFYFNTITGESSWFKPMIMGSNDLNVSDSLPEYDYDHSPETGSEQKDNSDIDLEEMTLKRIKGDNENRRKEFSNFLAEHDLDVLEEILVNDGFDDLEALGAMRKADMPIVGIKEAYQGPLMEAINEFRKSRGIILDDSDEEEDEDEIDEITRKAQEQEENSETEISIDEESKQYSDEETEEGKEFEEQESSYFTESTESEDEEEDLGWKIETVFPGDHATFPRKGLFARVHFTASLLETGEVFESSRKRERPVDFLVGAGHVLPAWDKAIRKMSIGERAIITVYDPEMAYGAMGRPPLVPPNAKLKFEVELIDVYVAEIGELPDDVKDEDLEVSESESEPEDGKEEEEEEEED